MDSAHLPAVAAPQDKSGGKKLYKKFIDEAARLYGDALAHNEAAVSDLVRI